MRRRDLLKASTALTGLGMNQAGIAYQGVESLVVRLSDGAVVGYEGLARMDARIGLDTPAQVRAAPRAQPVAARQPPRCAQHHEPLDLLIESGVA